MCCTFFGHKNTFGIEKNDLKTAIVELIERQGVRKFYVGNNGRFDCLVQNALCELSNTYPDIEYYIVLAYISEQAMSGHQHTTIYPEGLEFCPLKYAISKRNEWMINHSKYVITYMQKTDTNCYKWVEKARRKGLEIINLALGKT